MQKNQKQPYQIGKAVFVFKEKRGLNRQKKPSVHEKIM